MQIEFLVDGTVSLLLAPENEMEEALLKQLMKQKNEITEIRTAVTLLNKTFRNGVFLGKRIVGAQANPMKEDKIIDDQNEEENV
jgi:hypothetical protein